MPESIALQRYDVLVLGAGGAGLRAAVAAAEEGAKVAVVSKSLLGKSQTAMGAALAVAMGAPPSRDTWGMHFADTLRGGRHVNQWRMAQLLAQELPQRVREMEAWGTLFDRAPQGDIRLGEGSGHRHARLARAGQHNTGLELLRTLQAQVQARGVDIYAEVPIVELLKDGERVAGAFGYRRDSGEPIAFVAPAVVLATGGIGKLYAFTTNFHDSTGDGHALACRAGAELIDMEFVQFFPTGMVAPESARGLLVAESVRAGGGVLRNAQGERFMFRYVPEDYRAEIAETEAEAEEWFSASGKPRRPPELLPRDQVSRAVEAEIRAGRGTANGGVLLDIASRRPADVIRRSLPHMYRQFMDLADVDITAAPMEVAPTCHFMMGGVRVDPDTGATAVPGLYAAGEAAGGLHGANRLNGNAISELLVFGARAGRHAAQHAKRERTPATANTAQIDAVAREVRAPLERSSGENSQVVLRDLQGLMQARVALLRSEEGLRSALEELEVLRARKARIAAPGGAAANPGWHCSLDLRSLFTVAEAVTRSALARHETRGAHVRDDFPAADAALARVNMVTRRGDGALQVRAEARSEMPADLSALALA
jgi:succinate dehydrogenase / fumarate reductase flavoprotein subunit